MSRQQNKHNESIVQARYAQELRLEPQRLLSNNPHNPQATAMTDSQEGKHGHQTQGQTIASQHLTTDFSNVVNTTDETKILMDIKSQLQAAKIGIKPEAPSHKIPTITSLIPCSQMATDDPVRPRRLFETAIRLNRERK